MAKKGKKGAKKPPVAIIVTIVVIILVILFGVFAFVPIKEVLIRIGVVTMYRGDNWKIIRKTKDPVYDKVISLETDIENRYNNYFPLIRVLLKS